MCECLRGRSAVLISCAMPLCIGLRGADTAERIMIAGEPIHSLPARLTPPRLCVYVGRQPIMPDRVVPTVGITQFPRSCGKEGVGREKNRSIGPPPLRFTQLTQSVGDGQTTSTGSFGLPLTFHQPPSLCWPPNDSV